MAHTDPKELLRRVDRAREMVQIGGYYRHAHDGSLYRVRDVVLREEDLTPSVDYRSVNGPPITWNRKLHVFVERFYRVEFSGPPPPAEDPSD
jgi:hypothetical protein